MTKELGPLCHSSHRYIYKGEQYYINGCSMSGNREVDLLFCDRSSDGRCAVVTNKQEYETKNCLKTIALLISQKCNMACTYCYADGGEYGEAGSMSYDIAKRAVDLLVRNSELDTDLAIIFFGGEPLLEFKLIRQITFYAKAQCVKFSRKVSFSITTNGSLLKDDRLLFFKLNSFNVMVSIDGGKKTQDAQRPFKDGRGSYEQIIPMVRKLLKLLPDSPARATYTGEYFTPLEIRNDLHKVGFKHTGIAMASGTLFDHKDRNKAPNGIIRLLEEDADALLIAINDRRSDLMDLDISLLNYLLQFIQKEKSYYPCGAGRGLIAVSSNGDIYPCHRFVGMPKYRIGKIGSDENIRASLFNVSPLQVSEKCFSCFAKFLCGGACYHDSFTENGSLYEPDEDLCKIMKRTMELIVFIKSQLNEEDLNFLSMTISESDDVCGLDFF